jgi:branched-chain amino acid transport system ATP-binding protein
MAEKVYGADSAPLLEIQNINRFFGGLHAVNDVSFSVREHSVKAVIGPNGAGKTTLFNLIAGSLTPSSGSVHHRGTVITGYKPHEVAYRGILRTFQSLKLCSHMTALENAMLGAHTRGKAGLVAGILNLGWTKREEESIREKAFKTLETLGLADVADIEVGNLPFGKQRGVEFARALAADPELLLLDEPASGLNMHETAELAELILKIRDTGKTILLVEHDMSLVMDISDEIVVLNFGKKIAEGRPREVQQNREVINIYLGEEDA